MNNVKDQIGYDVNGFPVFQGDLVWVNPPRYKGLIKAKITKITPKGFSCHHYIKTYNTFNVPMVVMALIDINRFDLDLKCKARNAVLKTLSENYPELYI